MTFWKEIGCTALATVVLAGCNSGGDTASTAPSNSSPTAATGGKKITDLKITMIAKSNNNPVFQSAKVGAEQAAKDAGAKNGVKITIDWEHAPDGRWPDAGPGDKRGRQ